MITADSGAGRSWEVGEEGGGFPLALGTFPDGSLAIGGGMAFSSSEGFPSRFIRPTSRHVIVGSDGLGNRVAGVLMQERMLDGHLPPLEMIGVPDRFGESGKPWQLVKHFGLAAEHIADRARILLGLKK